MKMRRKMSTAHLNHTKFVWLCIAASTLNHSPPHLSQPLHHGITCGNGQKERGSWIRMVVGYLLLSHHRKQRSWLDGRDSWKPSVISEFLSFSVCLIWLVCNDDLSYKMSKLQKLVPKPHTHTSRSSSISQEENGREQAVFTVSTTWLLSIVICQNQYTNHTST